LQGKRPATIDAYARAVRRITAFFDKAPDMLTTADLKLYFNSLIQTHSWSTIKLDRNGLQFFYRYTLDKQWEWLAIVKPPQVRRIPDILTSKQVSEGLNLTIHDIDKSTMLVHVRYGKGERPHGTSA
jgi:integrase/recombinase XerD